MGCYVANVSIEEPSCLRNNEAHKRDGMNIYTFPPMSGVDSPCHQISNTNIKLTASPLSFFLISLFPLLIIPVFFSSIIQLYQSNRCAIPFKMQYSSIFLATLAVTGTLAAPWRRSTDKNIRVILSNQATETGSQTTFTEGQRQQKAPIGSNGPFRTVELQLGAGVQNQDYRCQVLDPAGKPIVVLRGANTDITFADGDNGEWTFREPSEVSAIICDPSFKKVGSDATEIRVALSNQATETGSQTVFSEGQREQKAPVGSSGPFQTVELSVGALVQKQDYRCQVVDKAGKPIIVLRGENRDITFSDADKGEWTFETVSEVSQIVCDPAFKAAAV